MFPLGNASKKLFEIYFGGYTGDISMVFCLLCVQTGCLKRERVLTCERTFITEDVCIAAHLLRCLRLSGSVMYLSTLPSPSVSDALHLHHSAKSLIAPQGSSFSKISTVTKNYYSDQKPVHTFAPFRSCFEFISEATQEYVSDDFVSSFDEHSKLPVRINDGTNGQKQAPIDPKQNGE